MCVTRPCPYQSHSSSRRYCGASPTTRTRSTYLPAKTPGSDKILLFLSDPSFALVLLREQAMAEINTKDDAANNASGKEQGTGKGIAEVDITSDAEDGSQTPQTSLVPLRMKLISILLVTAVGFGSHWSSGVTGAMKATLKKVRLRDKADFVGTPGEWITNT
jgi:hypothetical protein